MSDEVTAGIIAIATQVVTLIVFILKSRTTAKKIDEVHAVVNGSKTALEAKLSSQEATIGRLLAALPAKRGRPRRPVTDADVGSVD